MSLDNVTIGDKLVVTTDYGQRLEVVERITSTLVITKGSRFNKSSGGVPAGLVGIISMRHLQRKMILSELPRLNIVES